jgi:hypothetical protein
LKEPHHPVPSSPEVDVARWDSRLGRYATYCPLLAQLGWERLIEQFTDGGDGRGLSRAPNLSGRNGDRLDQLVEQVA